MFAAAAAGVGIGRASCGWNWSPGERLPSAAYIKVGAGPGVALRTVTSRPDSRQLSEKDRRTLEQVIYHQHR